MRAWRLVPEPEMRTVIRVGGGEEDMAAGRCEFRAWTAFSDEQGLFGLRDGSVVTFTHKSSAIC
jgi:hypothetical protein